MLPGMLSGMLWRPGRVRDGSAATAPPSASLPAGLSGGRILSLIHASLLIALTRRSRVPTFMNRCSQPRPCMLVCVVGGLAVGYYAEKSTLLRPSGARNFRREECLHGKCGHWRTTTWYSAFPSKRKLKSFLRLRFNRAVTPRVNFRLASSHRSYQQNHSNCGHQITHPAANQYRRGQPDWLIDSQPREDHR